MRLLNSLLKFRATRRVGRTLSALAKDLARPARSPPRWGCGQAQATAAV